MFNKAVLWDISYGVYVVSSMDNKRPTGCIANCVVQLTKNTIAVSLNHQNYTNKVIKNNKSFSVCILPQNANPEIISVFGFSCGENTNKFDNIKYKLVESLPVLDNSKSYVLLKTIQEIELETHTLFIGEIIGGNVLTNEIPMTYKYYHDVIKGFAPKNAPTYIPLDELIQKTGQKRYKCKICGYIYEGDLTKEKDDFVCPVCKKPKEFFEEI